MPARVLGPAPRGRPLISASGPRSVRYLAAGSPAGRSQTGFPVLPIRL